MIVKQLRYYNEDQKKGLNSPKDLTSEMLISGEYFSPLVCSEIQVECAPGVILEINSEEIYIGEIGKYSIPYREGVLIASLKVKEESMSRIKNDTKGYIIITFIQE